AATHARSKARFLGGSRAGKEAHVVRPWRRRRAAGPAVDACALHAHHETTLEASIPAGDRPAARRLVQLHATEIAPSNRSVSPFSDLVLMSWAALQWPNVPPRRQDGTGTRVAHGSCHRLYTRARRTLS